MNDESGPVRHGGDLAAATARYGMPAGGWVDLSTAISPFSYPLPELDPSVWARLPDGARMTALIAAARKAYGAGERAQIAPAPGTRALIERLPHMGGGHARVAVVSPTRGGHARAWRREGHSVSEVSGLPEPEDFEVVILANPNNPDGRLFSRHDLVALADDLGAREGVLIVDESFVDPLPHRSLAGEAGHRALVVLRSFGNFFGLPGLRLGFALGPGRIIRRLEEVLGPWPVSGPAIEIGTRALGDGEWIEGMRLRLAEGAKRLDALLKEAGYGPAGGTPLFRLVEHPMAPTLRHRLAGEGVWTKGFDERPGWLRIGLPRGETAFARLERALGTIASDMIVERRHAAD